MIFFSATGIAGQPKGSCRVRGCVVLSISQRISVILNHRALWMPESLFMEELRAKR
ncbi:MAG: hypothetical protein K0S10_2200 [Rubrobacteraceae bacterium]|nr:hypothetical protein [Rubrobacteraceae bacterium]